MKKENNVKVKNFIEVIKVADVAFSSHPEYADVTTEDIITLFMINYDNNGCMHIKDMIRASLQDSIDLKVKQQIERRVSKYTKKLSDKNLIIKERHPEDKRNIVIKLTPRSLSLIKIFEDLLDNNKVLY